MGYSDQDYMVRVDFFKPSGKWYTTEAISMVGLYEFPGGPMAALKKALETHLGERLSEFIAICIEPYHKHSYPVIVNGKNISGWDKKI